MDEPRTNSGSWQDLAWPLAVYACVLLPFCAAFLFFYPDERFYLDASLTMFRTGDVMVPRFDDGTPRLVKPVLTYWIMLGSFHVFGVHLLAARLPFLLAGAVVLCLTHRLALLLSQERKVARLAVWIVLANPLFWLSCMRCLPDILLALFALMTVVGFFSWLAGKGNVTSAGWLLFGGIGLALGVKGLPGLLLLGCLGLHTLRQRPGSAPRWSARLIVPLMGGASIAVAGFVPILWNHAGATAAEMWRDQFASRLAGKTWGVVYRVPLLLVTLTGLFLPWLLPCLLHAGRKVFAIRPATSWERFLTLTTVLWLVATAATENCSIRYLFPLFPWIAVTLAMALARCDLALLERYSRCLLVVIAVLAAIVLSITGVVALQLELRWQAFAAIATLAFGVVLSVWFGWRSDAWRRFSITGALGPATLLAAFLALAPLLLPDLGAQARQSLTALPCRVDDIGVIGSPCQVSRVRLALAPKQTTVKRLEAGPAHGPIVLVNQAEGECLSAQDYDFYPAAQLLDRVSTRDLLSAFGRGELGAFLKTQATSYSWAVPRNNTAQ